jgi:alkylhydroperoxidase family enzyme
MRLSPIERPDSLKMRLAYGYVKKRLGKVITPMKVLYARVPEALPVVRATAAFLEHGMKLDPALKHLVMHLVALRNNCGFCVDISCAQWLSGGGSLAKVRAVTDYSGNDLFTDAERTALAYADELNRTRDVRDETFAELRKHYDERSVVEITWLVAQENFYNILNKPMGIESDGLCLLTAPEKMRETAATGG